MNRKCLIGFAVSACLLILSATSDCGAAEYRIKSLGVLPSYATTYPPMAMNAAGQAVGFAFMPDSGRRAYLFTPGSGLTNLGTLEGDTLSSAYGINDAGQVVGSSSVEVEGATRAFLYTPGVGMSSLDALGGRQSAAMAINNAGQVAGFSDTSGGERHAFLYTPGSGATDLQVPVGYDPYGINDLGWVAGTSATGEVFLYTPGSGVSYLGSEINPDLSIVHGINNAGQVIGYFYSGSYRHGYVYTPGSGIVDLGKDYIPRGINDAGQVVGYYPSGPHRPFLYTPGLGITALDILGRATEAYNIDENGRIIGMSFDAGHDLHIVAWEPVPEPSSVLALGSGLLALGRLIRRRR